MTTVDKIVTETKSKKATKAKNTLNKFVKKINRQLETYFNKEIGSSFNVSAKERKLTLHILEHIKEHNLRPAKRLRASFVYFAYKMLGGKKLSVALDAAMCVEIVHTALLMHDDFMDQDDTRRGLATTHEYYKQFHKTKKFRFAPSHYGESMAVTVGDVALCLGYELLGRANADPERKIDALIRMLRGITNTAFGQAFDITLESEGKASEKDITDLHHAKTAIYTYQNPLHVGAILAGAKSDDLEILSKYAIPGGVAFQIQDDMLGLFGDTEKTGKPAHSDLRQGKMTLLIIKALDFGNSKQIRRIKEIWGKRDLTEKDAEVVRKIVRETGSYDYSVKIAKKWARKAQEAIPVMHKKGWSKKGVEYLDGVAQYMIERDW
jgi:geranylgeranyl diphosphate synthase type I